MNRLSELFFNVDEVAELSGLHPKTVQRFIREGRLKGQKIGRAWKIHRDDLKDFTHSELAEDGWNNTSSRIVFSDEDRVSGEGRLSVSASIELKESASDESSRISNTIIAVLNSKDPSWGKTGFDFYHDPDSGTARYVLSGSPAFISAMMKALEPLLEELAGEAEDEN